MSVQTQTRDRLGMPTRPPPPRQVGWLVGAGTAGYFLLGLLGRLTIPEGEDLALVWPAAGAAMLVFAWTVPRRWGVAALLLALATIALDLLTGATSTQAVILAASVLVQSIGAVLVLRALAPRLRGAAGATRMDQPRDLWPVVIASVLGSLLGAGVGALGYQVALGGWSWADFTVWWVRNAVGCTVVATTGLLLASRRRWAVPGARAEALAAIRRRIPEATLLVLFTTALYLGTFDGLALRPVASPLLLPTLWVGLRFKPLPAVLHGWAVCTAVVAFTLAGHGPFAGVGPWDRQVFVSQVFVGLTFCLGALLALDRSERFAMTDVISTARAASEGQAQVLATIIEAMHDGVSLVDESGQVLMRNTAGAQLARAEIGATNHIRESQFKMMHPDGRELTQDEYPWTQAFAGRSVIEQDVVLVFDDGSPSRTLSMTAHLLPHDQDGGLEQAVVIYHDVTTDRAQRSALESFAGVAAHDLSGPLGVIDGWAEMLQLDLTTGGSLDADEAAPKLERIRVTVSGMRRLVDDLLDSSTSRDQRLRSTVLDLDAETRALVAQRVGTSTGEPPRIEVAPLPRVYADAAMVRQLLANLIGNAVKYVVPGQVPQVRISAREVKGRIEVTVADEGIGIPAGQRDQIFDAFERGDSVAGYEGHGIGLAVCKSIVERHGGMIAARPPRGDRGARIVFTLPAVPPGSDTSEKSN